MDGIIKYLKNTSWLLGNRAYSMAVGFFVTIIVTRYLGPENYGMLSYAISFVGLFSFIATLGIEQLLYRDLIKHKDKEHILLGTSLTLRLVAGSAASLCALIVAYLIGERDIGFWLIAIISLSFIFQAFNVINYAFQARVESKYPSIATFIVVTILALLKLAVVWSGKGIYFFGAIYALESLLYAAIFIFFYRTRYGSPRAWRFKPEIARSMLMESSPLILSTIFVSVYSRIDQIMLKHMIDVKAVGVYDAAVKIAELWYFIPAILISSFYPSIVNSFNHDKKKYAKRTLRLTAGLVGLSTLTAAIIATVAYPIMNIVYGNEFTGGYQVLQLYVWAGIGISLGSMLTQYLVTEGLTRTILFISLIGMIVNVLLNLILIPRYGINGAALATLVSSATGPLCILFFKAPRLRLRALIRDYRS